MRELLIILAIGSLSHWMSYVAGYLHGAREQRIKIENLPRY